MPDTNLPKLICPNTRCNSVWFRQRTKYLYRVYFLFTHSSTSDLLNNFLFNIRYLSVFRIQVIKRHFDLLNFLLRNAELTLSVERAKALWETLIGQTRAAPFDREVMYYSTTIFYCLCGLKYYSKTFLRSHTNCIVSSNAIHHTYFVPLGSHTLIPVFTVRLKFNGNHFKYQNVIH